KNYRPILQTFCVMYRLNSNRRAKIGPINPIRITDPNGWSVTFGLESRDQRFCNQSFSVAMRWVDDANVGEVKLAGSNLWVSLPFSRKKLINQMHGLRNFTGAVFFANYKYTSTACQGTRLIGANSIGVSFSLAED